MVKTWSIFHYFPIKGGWSPIHHSVSFRPPEFQVGLQRSNLAIDKLRQFHPLIDDLFPIQLPKPIRGYVSPIKPTICRWFSHQTHHLWIVFPCFPHSTHLFWIFLDDFPIEKAGFRLVWTLTAQVVLGPNYDPRVTGEPENGLPVKFSRWAKGSRCNEVCGTVMCMCIHNYTHNIYI